MKLILSDLDGTLLRATENRISEKALNAISGLESKGIRFAIASGRAISELWHLFSRVQDKMYFVACDGALIFEGKKLILDAPMQNIAQFDKAQSVLLQGRYMTYVKGQPAFVREMKLHYRGYTIEFESASEIEEPIYKAVVFDRAFQVQQLNMVYSDIRLAEYTAEGVNKGSATRFLLKHFGVDASEAMAFGDNTNDIPMLLTVEHSVAVRNAKQAVLKICKNTTDDVVQTIMSI